MPVPVQDLAGATAVSAGGCYSLALLSNGTVSAWGYNDIGQLGDGTTTERLLPVTVKGLSGVVGVSAGASTSLAVLGDGRVMAWGDNLSGELGTGSTRRDSTVPVLVHGITTATAVFAGNNFCFALLRDGTVMAWGDNSAGELGTGEHGAPVSDVPVLVQGIHTAVGVAAGYEHSAAVLANGTVMSWGSNQDGQLGIATRNFYVSDDPIQVFRVTGAVSVGAGDFFGAALLRNGTAAAWGSDDTGQLGNGVTDDPEEPAPVPVSGLTTATQLSAGGGHVLVMASAA